MQPQKDHNTEEQILTCGFELIFLSPLKETSSTKQKLKTIKAVEEKGKEGAYLTYRVVIMGLVQLQSNLFSRDVSKDLKLV